MQKAVVKFNGNGPSGNIYCILGAVRNELRKQRRILDYNEMWERVQTSNSYEDALKIIREYVDLIDLDGRF